MTNPIRFSTARYQVNFAEMARMFCVLDKQDSFRCVAAFDTLEEAKEWLMEQRFSFTSRGHVITQQA